MVAAAGEEIASPERNLPRAILLTLFIVLALVALTGSVLVVAEVGGFLYVLHFMFPLIALVMLRWRGGPPPVFRVPVPRVVLPLAFAGCLLLLVISGWTGVLGGLGWLLIGLLAYGVVVAFKKSSI